MEVLGRRGRRSSSTSELEAVDLRLLRHPSRREGLENEAKSQEAVYIESKGKQSSPCMLDQGKKENERVRS